MVTDELPEASDKQPIMEDKEIIKADVTNKEDKVTKVGKKKKNKKKSKKKRRKKFKKISQKCCVDCKQEEASVTEECFRKCLLDHKDNYKIPIDCYVDNL